MALPGLGYSGGSATHPGAFSVARAYAAGATSASSARKQGATYSLVDVLGEARKRRRFLLEAAIASGKIKPEDIGKSDLMTLGTVNPSTGQIDLPGVPKPGHGIGNILKNLGRDIWSTTIHLPGGVYGAGKSVLSDIAAKPASLINPLGPIGAAIAAPALRGGKSEVYQNILKPTAQSYAYTYGGVGAPPGSSLGERLAEHPLQPILDVATLASVGLGGAARAGGVLSRVAEPGTLAARTGRSLASLTSREGRAPLVSPFKDVEGGAFPEIPREYTPRPLSKLGQRALDVFTKTGPGENRLGRFVREREERRLTRREQNIAQAERFMEEQQALEGMGDFTGLTDDEAFALTLSQMGINSPAKLDAMQRMVRMQVLGKEGSVSVDPKVLQRLENQGMSREYIERMANLPKPVKALVLRPTPGMVNAHKAWKARVDELAESEGGALDTAAQQEEIQGALEPYMRGAGGELPRGDYEIEPVAVPVDRAAGFERYTPHLPQRLAASIPGFRNVFDLEKGDRFRRGPTDRPSMRQVTRENLMVPKAPPGAYAQTGEVFQTGTFRTDARNYLEHVTRTAGQKVDEAWKRSHINRVAAKEQDGSLVKVSGGTKGQKEADARFGEGKTVAIPADFPIAWFRSEVNYAEKFTDAVDAYLKQHGDEELTDIAVSEPLEEFLSRMTDEDAQAFVGAHWGALKRKQVVIPKSDYDYMLKFANIDTPFNSRTARFLTRWMHRWRAATLAYMPRWAINTAIGSFVMNAIRGVSFKDYWISEKLRKQGLLPEGVNLGHQAQLEFLEAAGPGYGASKAAQFMGDMGIRLPGGALVQGVQNIENFFRRAAFVHNLRRERRLQRDREGRLVDVEDGVERALSETEAQLSSFYGDIFGGTRRVSEALNDPKVIERALDETNKFMYNYSILGPTERRMLRQFIPFWGWYKFISEAAYRLPVEYPGRFNALQALSNIAAEQESEFGPMPEWLMGALPLQDAPLVGGAFKYLPTMGMNPFAQVFNPLGPKGALEGTIGLGQFNPLIQAGLSAAGFDTLSGDRVSISPESGVGESFFGNLFQGDREVKPAQVAPFRRFIMGLARSFPEFRLSERYVLNPSQGFGAAYPESVPFIAPRPMGPATGGTAEPGFGTVAGMSLGVWPRKFDLDRYQRLYRDEVKYARKRQIRGAIRLRSKIESGR